MDNEKMVELVNQWKTGDSNAYAELYRAFHDSMLRIALKNTQTFGHNNMSDAEDVLQDAMLKAYNNIEKLEDSSKFAGWLSQIVVNQCRDYMGSAVKKNVDLFVDKTAEDDEGKEVDYATLQEDKKETYRPDIQMDDQARRKILDGVMDGLSKEQRIVTTMYFYDDMSLKEISETLGVEMSTVVGRYQTAKKKIKTEISAIQKRDDIKLYNISAVPAISFFMYLMGTAKETGESAVTGIGATGVVSANPNIAIKETTNPQKTVSNNISNGVQAESTTTSSSTTVSTAAGAKASSVVGASLTAKIVTGVVVAAVAVGGGYALKSNVLDKQDNNKLVSVVEETDTQKDENTAESEATVEPAATPKTKTVDQQSMITDESNIINVDIPDGWIAQNEEAVTGYNLPFGQKIPIYAIYSGEAGDKTKPFVLISSLEQTTGLGGDVAEGAVLPLVFYDSYINENSMIVDSVSGPLSQMEPSAYVFAFGYPGIKEDEKCYVYYIHKKKDVFDGFQLVYFPMGDESKLEDVKEMVNSFSPTSLGELEINVSNLNIRYEPSTSATVGPGNSWTGNGQHNTVYQITKAEGYTWYRIGSYSWVADNGKGWVTYTAY